MIKKSIQLGAALLLALAFVLSSCEGPVGPAGAATPSTVPGTEGYSPATTVAAAGALFANGVKYAYLSASDGSTNTVINIPNGATLLVPAIASTMALGTGSGGIKVQSGGTLLISGKATINTGGIDVESGGTLIVRNGGILVATTGQTLTVRNGATVTVEADGALGSTAAVTYTGAALDGILVASKIGNAPAFSAATVANYGPIDFKTGSWYYTGVADGSEITAAKGFSVTDKIWMGAALTNLTPTISTAVGIGKTLYVNAAITTLSATTIAGTVTGTGMTGDIIAGDALTVSGALSLGTVTALTGAAGAGTAFSLVTTGTGKIVIGTLSGSVSSVEINGDVTITGTAAIASGKSLTVKAGKTLTIAALSTGDASVGVTAASTAGAFVLEAGASIVAQGTNSSVTYTGASTIAHTGNGTAKFTVTKATGRADLTTGVAVATLKGGTISLVNGSLVFNNEAGGLTIAETEGGNISADGTSIINAGGSSGTLIDGAGGAKINATVHVSIGTTLTGAALIAQFGGAGTVVAADAGDYSWSGSAWAK